MRISYLFNSSTPSSNPGSIQVVNTCNGIASLGHKILIITPGTGEKTTLKKFYGIENNVQLKKIKYFKKFPLGISYYLFSFVSILYAIHLKTEVFITRNFFTLILLNIFKKKTIIEVHHDLNSEGRLVRYLFKKFNIFNKRNIIKIIAITNEVKKFLIKSYNIPSSKIETIPSASGLKFKFRKFKKKKKYNLGYFGSLNYTKGSSFILKLSKIDKENNYFIFGGSKKEVFELKKINTAKNLKISCSLPYGKIKNYISKMDILLLPSNLKKIYSLGNIGNIAKYTSPLKLFDYMSSGRLIISSNVKVYKEILENKKNCILVNNLKAESWKKIIMGLTNRIMYVNFLKKNAYNDSKKFTYQKRAEKLLKF